MVPTAITLKTPHFAHTGYVCVSYDSYSCDYDVNIIDWSIMVSGCLQIGRKSIQMNFVPQKVYLVLFRVVTHTFLV